MPDSLDGLQRLGPGSAFPAWMEALEVQAFGDTWHLLVDGETGFLLPDRAFALWRLTPAAEEAELLRIAVRPDLRGRGVARALLAAGEEALRREGARTLLLEVRASNAAARALYAAAGWAEAGLRRGYYRDGEDAVLCTKVLSP
jgi:ribosomal-protein-alanine N-acetyltransferase